DDVMRLEHAPDSLIVLGAGGVGLELSQFFARIGTRVLLVNRSPLLSRFDVECGRELERALCDETNLELAIPGRILDVEPSPGGLSATIRCGDRQWRQQASALLMATGRRAAIDELGLEHVGVRTTAAGVVHDDAMRTTNPSIFVAGDATGRHQLLHLANQEGTVAGHNAAVGQAALRMDRRLKMSVIYTDPPFAIVGANESEIRANVEFVTGRARFADTGRAITMGARHGLWKLWANKAEGEILGSAIVGPRADDLIHLISTAMYYRATSTALCSMPWYHPTLSEVILNLARDISRQLRVDCTIPGAATLAPGYSTTMRDRAND
ncbi:MAG TPA: FAD-dependent oxidoreductase, partial [Candidatus Polarisedimenticolaceae bacterium]|nr:FAD-dependent oxidoreductase [Candidatus Polarisedimenticolaceae bacterium]